MPQINHERNCPSPPFRTHGSDLDLCIVTQKIPDSGGSRARWQQTALLQRIEKDLRANFFENNFPAMVYCIPAKIPLVKIEPFPIGAARRDDTFKPPTIDISINNTAGIRNTAFVAVMTALDSRLRTLMRLIKAWGRASEVTDR